MENFLVSARKYRPQVFETVVGQSHVTGTLKNAIINQQLAQAYLFCGPRGVGKTTCARIFAKTINCENPLQGEPCNRCTSCSSFNEGSSLNIYELDAASNNSVDDIRQLVDLVRFAPQMGSFKVYIIDEVHMLSTAAFNAFLKTLEEPPVHAKFILATTEKHKIIPTILSRCQVFTFNRIKLEDISRHLAYLAQSEHVRAEPEALTVIAEKAEGGLRDACSLFDQMVASTNSHLTYAAVVEHLHVLDASVYFKISDTFLNSNRADSLLIFNEVLNQGFDPHQFIMGLGQHFRNMYLCKFPAAADLLETSPALKERYIHQAKSFAEVLLVKFITLVQKVDAQYKASKNQRLLIEWVLLQMSYLSVSEAPEKKKSLSEPDAEQPTASNATHATALPVQAQVATPANVPAPLNSELKQNSAQPVIGETSALNTTVEIDLTQKNKAADVLQSSASNPAIASGPMQLNPTQEISETLPLASGPSSGTLKIKSGFSITVSKQKKEHKATEALQNALLPDEPIRVEQIREFLFQHAEMLQTKGQYQKSILFKNAHVELIGSECSLTLMNETQMELFDALKQDLLDQMRLQLKHRSLQLSASISKSDTSLKAFRPADILVEMSQKNPLISSLKQELDLDIDY